MVNTPLRPLFAIFLPIAILYCNILVGQEMHRIHTTGLPMGEVGQTRLAQGGAVHGYYQPVQFCGPEGTSVSLSVESRFIQAQSLPATTGLLLGHPYRFRVTGIPFHEGQAVYPTIELIDRTYPPINEALDFPIVVEISQDDLEMALAGKYITKVIYLENPQIATVAQSDPRSPLSWDAQPGDDPLNIASSFGRPVAIVRIGGRVPSGSGTIDPSFFLGSPPWIGVARNEQGKIHLTHHFNKIPAPKDPLMTVPSLPMVPQNTQSRLPVGMGPVVFR